MKLCGFRKEFDPNLFSTERSPHLVKLDAFQLENVVEYLSQGTFLMGAMSYIYDSDGTAIGNLDYYTDGIFVWPSYFVFYLKKDAEKEIDQHFYNHMEQNKFNVPVLPAKIFESLEEEFLGKWMQKKG